jgi:hypothetical protein
MDWALVYLRNLLGTQLALELLHAKLLLQLLLESQLLLLLLLLLQKQHLPLIEESRRLGDGEHAWRRGTLMLRLFPQLHKLLLLKPLKGLKL